jgi:hypothetical protein
MLLSNAAGRPYAAPVKAESPAVAVVRAVPEFICGMSAYVGVSSKFHSFKVLIKFKIIPRIKRYKPKRHIFWLKAKTLH